MIDPAAVALDESLGPGHHLYVATHAWWMATFGLSERRFSFPGENIMQVWIPADERQEWLLVQPRRRTGKERTMYVEAGCRRESAAAWSASPL